MRLLAPWLALPALVLGTALAGTAPRAAAASAEAALCHGGAHGSPGYAYAGRQSAVTAQGVRATITPLAAPVLHGGHVAGWIGVGGPGQGPRGETMWLQAGVVAVPGSGLIVYTVLALPNAAPRFTILDQGRREGEAVRLAVREDPGQPDRWRVWVDGRPATDPVLLPGTSGLWRPIATAETYDGGASTCNAFAFRFERVGVLRDAQGAWRPFVPGATFLDRGVTLRQLRPVADGQRLLTSDPVEAFAFEATSAG